MRKRKKKREKAAIKPSYNLNERFAVSD